MDTCSNGLCRDALKLAKNELLYSSYAMQTNRAWIMQQVRTALATTTPPTLCELATAVLLAAPLFS
jgi:hypothetical protein